MLETISLGKSYCGYCFSDSIRDIMTNMERIIQSLARTGERPLAMGILNITPDSFHDGGCYSDTASAVKQALTLAEEGADIIDVGAASSRPGYTPLSAAEESSRLMPVLEALKDEFLPPLSIDTDKAEVAAAALDHGVNIINDTSGDIESGCFELAAARKAPLIVMHREAGEHERDVVAEVERFFNDALKKAAAVGLPPHLLVFDPGLGFNKDLAENAALIEAIPRFKQLGQPILIGYSHKRYTASLAGETPGNAPVGNAILARRVCALGADIIRVHEVQAFWESIGHG